MRRTTQMKRTKAAVAVAIVGALAFVGGTAWSNGPWRLQPDEVRYNIPPTADGKVNPDPFLANGVTTGWKVPVYTAAGTGPAGKNTLAPSGTPARYIDYDVLAQAVPGLRADRRRQGRRRAAGGGDDHRGAGPEHAGPGAGEPGVGGPHPAGHHVHADLRRQPARHDDRRLRRLEPLLPEVRRQRRPAPPARPSTPTSRWSSPTRPDPPAPTSRWPRSPWPAG